MRNKCKKRSAFKEVKNYLEGSKIFWVSVIIACIFVISPLLLRNNSISITASKIFEPLKLEGYKSSYIETVGSLLGTFLAITGALWTQRKEEKRKEKQEIKEAATIIYYEFKTALEDIFSLVSTYEEEKEKQLLDLNNKIQDMQTKLAKENNRNYINEIREKTRQVEEIKNNKNLLSPYNYIEIYIHENWICNAAKLNTMLSDAELKQIYELYGKILLCRSYLDNNYNMIREHGFRDFYEFLISEVCQQSRVKKKDIGYRNEHMKIMCRLEKIMNGVCSGCA